jgi:hypothetical protein
MEVKMTQDTLQNLLKRVANVKVKLQDCFGEKMEVLGVVVVMIMLVFVVV